MMPTRSDVASAGVLPGGEAGGRVCGARGRERWGGGIVKGRAVVGNVTRVRSGPTTGMWTGTVNPTLTTVTEHVSELTRTCRMNHWLEFGLRFRLVMISQKPPGAISGDQSLDGNFRWSKVLPGDCRMSE